MAFDTCVIVNPTSGGGAVGRRWPELQRGLDRVLERWQPHFTTAPGHATELARQAVEDGREMIVCVGGDGTMNEVVNGLFASAEEGVSGRLLRTDVVLAPVRQGTGGDFARHLGLSGRLPAAVDHLRGDATRPCDLGLVEFEDAEGRFRRRAFLNIASFGMSGLVDDKVNRSTKAFGGTASFLMGLMRALAAYRPQRVQISVDGAPFYSDGLVTGGVANGQFFGGGMHFAPRAAHDDGLFDVVVQVRAGVKEVLSIRDLYSERFIDWPTVRSTRGQTISARPVDPNEVVLLDVDGEQPGRLPATFRMVSPGVRLKVAGPAADANAARE